MTLSTGIQQEMNNGINRRLVAGFTLVELLVVIAIIGILVALLLLLSSRRARRPAAASVRTTSNSWGLVFITSSRQCTVSPRGVGPRITRATRDGALSCLSITGMTRFADRLLGELSGGQRQLVWIAMALAQNTELLLLDEPTTFLDMAHQLEVLEVLERLHQQQQRTIVMVLHDINQAARYSNFMVALVDGRIAASGWPHEILTPDVLADEFDIDAEVIIRGDVKAPFCIPLRIRK